MHNNVQYVYEHLFFGRINSPNPQLGGSMLHNKKLFMVVLLLVSSLIVVGCGGGGAALKLSELDPTLTDCEKTSLDGIQETILKPDELGNEKYDKLFLEAAKINAALTELNHVILTYKNDKKAFIQSDQNRKCAVGIVQYGLKAIPQMTASATSLVDQLKALDPTNDFTGLNARKIPDATAGIAESVKNLNSSIQQFASILTELGVISKELE